MMLPGLSLTPRDRRALLVGVTVMGAIVVGGRALPAWRHWQATARTDAAAATLELARSRVDILGQRSARDSLAARKKRLDALHSAWLDGDTPAAAGAALAGAISSAGQHAGVGIGALDIRVDSASASVFAPVRVHATAVGDIQGIVNFLTGIEADRAYVSVRALSIDAADPAAAANRPEVLRAELTVEAPWRRATQEIRP